MGRINPLSLRIKHHYGFPQDVRHPPLAQLAAHVLQPFLHSPARVRASPTTEHASATVLVTREDAAAGWLPSAVPRALEIPPDMRGAEGHVERRIRAAKGGWYPHMWRRKGIDAKGDRLWGRTVQPHAYFQRVARGNDSTPLVALMEAGKPREAFGIFRRDRPDGMVPDSAPWLPASESSGAADRMGGWAATVEARWADIRDGRVVDQKEDRAPAADSAAAPEGEEADKPAPRSRYSDAPSYAAFSPWSYSPAAPRAVRERLRLRNRKKWTPTTPLPLPSAPAISTLPPSPPPPLSVPLRLNVIRNPLMHAGIAAQYVAWCAARGQKPEAVFLRLSKLLRPKGAEEAEEKEEGQKKKGGKGKGRGRGRGRK